MNFTNKPKLNSDGSVPADYYNFDYWEKGAESGKGSYNGNDYFDNVEACKIWSRDCYNRWGPFTSFLELGCGRGWNIYGFLAQPELGITKMLGVDHSHYAVTTAAETVRPYLKENSIADLSFIEDKAFELIFSNDVLEHLTPSQALSCLTHCKRISSKRVAHLISIADGQDLPDGVVPNDQDQSHVNLKSADWWKQMFRVVFHHSGWELLTRDHGRTIEFDVRRY